MQSRHVSPQHLRAALAFVVHAELTPAKVGAKLGDKAAVDELRVMHEPWKALVTHSLRQRALALSNAQLQQADTVVTAAFASMQGPHMALPFADDQLQAVVQLTPADLAAKNFATTAVGGVYMELFSSYIQPEDPWKAFLAQYQAERATTAAVLAHVTELNVVYQEQYLLLDSSRTNLRPALDGLVRRGAEISGDPLFGKFAQPLADHLNALHAEYLDRLTACSDGDFHALLLQLSTPVPATGALIDITAFTAEDLRDHLSGMVQTCQYTSMDATSVLVHLDQSAFDALAPSLPTPPDREVLGEFAARYGLTGFRVLCDLNRKAKPDLVKLLDRWHGLCQVFALKVPNGSGYVKVMRFARLACTGSAPSDGETALHKEKSCPRITPPKGVTVFAWEEVNGIEFPIMFQKGPFSTDECCVKHVVEEVGVNPSVQKLTAYFAEMVDACSEASGMWGHTQQNGTVCVSAQARGRWKIIIGSGGQRKVFHVDSGYAKSRWTTP